VDTTVTDNVAPVASNVGGTDLLSFGSVIGPPSANPPGGGIQPPGPDCRIALHSVSSGFNVFTDGSCGLDLASDVQQVDVPILGPLGQNGGFGETRMPLPGSVLLDQIPAASCSFVPFGAALEGEQHLAEFDIEPFAAVTMDQRGMPRPQGARCDIGAVEGV
jgi:hypothetical protein